MSKPDLWMPLYIGDYLADTMRLTTLEHGAYLLLLMEYWRNGPLPDDDRALANIARIERKVWDREVGPALRRYFTKQGDVLRQKRIDAELAEAAKISEKRKAAAEARWNKSASSGGGSEPPPTASNRNANASPNGHAGADANEHPNDMLRAGTRPPASPSQSQKEERKEVPRAAAPEPQSAVDLLWREGLPILQRLTGKSPDGCRGLLGKLRRDARDDCPRLLFVLQQAGEMRPSDPVAWITAAVQERARSTRPSVDERLLRTMGLGEMLQ